MFDKNITLFNKKYDKATRTDVYVKTVLNNVHFEGVRASSIDDKETKVNDSLFVIIPFSVYGYLKPKEYQKQQDTLGRWTLQEGDIIVKGIVENDITSSKELKALDDVYTINSIEIVDYSVTCLNHFEVYAA